MKGIGRIRPARGLMCRLARALLSLFAAGACAVPGAWAAAPVPVAVPVLMVSDIHFDPFWDPGKESLLAAAPVSGWKSILAAPDSADREQRFSDLENNCHARGVDTSYALYASSLAAMRADAAGAKFVTVSGDLIAHSFACKYKTLFPQGSAADYRGFVEKTIEFVIGELRQNMPGVPVYAALGNNDSDCGDYQLDARSDFLRATGKVMAADLPEAERERAEGDFAAAGYFAARLPVPHTRMLVLDDLFMAKNYATCGGKPDARAAADQVAWLKQQLDDARRQKEKVWVMAHIPPGVDPYSTATKGGNICEGKEPAMFLSSEAMEETLAQYGDVIELAIFAHTHMDEVRLFVDRKSAGLHKPVAVKLVPSISPIDGNEPAFMVASVDAATATMMDYRVFVATNQTGGGATWSQEYDYAKDSGEPDFSASSVSALVSAFESDPTAHAQMSQSYLSHYSAGGVARALTPFWPLYVCALGHDSGDDYRACVCATGH
jgi:sphingomyelin phosphodiesterase acid-like 3